MIHWLGYAEIRFFENAHLVLARAVEQSGSEALSLHPDAWLVDDRSITLNVEADSPRAGMIAAKRLLSALLLEAEDGEAVIEVPPFERWSRSAGGAPSVHVVRGAPTSFDGRRPSPDTAVTDVLDRPTLPMRAGAALDGPTLPDQRMPPARNASTPHPHGGSS
jgi:hypothetical protein